MKSTLYEATFQSTVAVEHSTLIDRDQLKEFTQTFFDPNERYSVHVVENSVDADSLLEFLNRHEAYFTHDASLVQALHTKQMIFVHSRITVESNGDVSVTHLRDTLAFLDVYAADRDDVNRRPLVVIRSTVPVGTLNALSREYENLRLIYYPEFLPRNNTLDDFEADDRMVLGCEKYMDAIEVAGYFYSLSPERFENLTVFCTTYAEAEIIKLASNAHLFLKVLLSQNVQEICKQVVADARYDVVREALAFDPRIGPSHLMPPGSGLGQSNRMTGGLPKATLMLDNACKDLKVPNNLTEGALEHNAALELHK